MFDQISQGEIQYFKECLKNQIRYDGRGLCDVRESMIHSDQTLFPNALHGVRVDIPDSKSSFLIGINGSIEIKPQDTILEKTDFVSIELKASTESLEYEERVRQENNIKEMKDILRKFIIECINIEPLKLEGDVVYWNVICDIFVVGLINLNDFDYLIKGIRRCFTECRFPKISVSYNNWNEEYSYEILNNNVQLFMENDFPYVFLIGEYNGKIVLDMNREELHAVDSFYIVTVDCNGKLINFEKLDGKLVEINKLALVIRRIVEVSQLLLTVI